MFAYRHLFHAGGFADVFKHALLALVPAALGRKEAAWFYLDTHAGLGVYDLDHPWAQKNAEHLGGIALVWRRPDAPEAIRPYLGMLDAMNPAGSLRWYPGSPEIVRRLRRPGDRMVLVEHNRDDQAALAAHFAGERKVSVIAGDAAAALEAHLPPRERRGFALIDPPFDHPGELDRVVRMFREFQRRWASGMLLVWYPLLDPAAMSRFERRIADLGVRKILQLEIRLGEATRPGRLSGCGLLVLNPAFGFESTARPLLDWLAGVLSPAGTARVRWLVPE